MGLGRLLTRSTKELTVTDVKTGATETFVIHGGIAPNWASSVPYAGMRIPGAWRASTMLAGLIGQIPWDAYRKIGARDIERLEGRPLLDQPAPPEPAVNTYGSWGLDLIWNGNAIGIIAARDAQGYPTALYPVPAEMVWARRVTTWMNSGLPIGAVEYAIGPLRFGPSDIFHVKGHCRPGDLRGMGVLEAHMETLDLAQIQQQQARSVARHGVPTGVLTTTNDDIDDDDLKKAKAAWMKAQREATVAALAPGVGFTPLAWNPEQMQMIEARRFSLTELELIFGLPLGWLGGATSSRTYANIEQDGLNLIKFTLADHVVRFEQTLSLCFPRGTTVKANLDAFLRSDRLARYQAHAVGISSGFLLRDEARAMEDLPPLQAEEPAQQQPPADPAADDDQAGADDGGVPTEPDPLEEMVV